MSKCKTVTLRKRKIKNGTQYSLCLDYYPGYRDNVTMRVITREALGIYIFAKPANQQERDFNARMMKKAVILRNQRYEAIFNENNGFFDKTKMKGDFLAYFKGLADRKNIKWQHVYKHFQRFVNGKCTFEEVDVDLCRKFMEYLLDAPQSIHTNQKLHINSAAGYWSTFRAVLHTAYRDRKIKENPNGFLDRIECIPTIREHLSQEELIRLADKALSSLRPDYCCCSIKLPEAVSVLISAKKRPRVLYVVFPRCSEKENIGRISDESSRNALLAAANIVL